MLVKGSLSLHPLLRWLACRLPPIRYSSKYHTNWPFDPFSSIFFQTTYFSDYILVPHKSIHTVTKALEQRGFTFSHSAAAYVSTLSASSPVTPRHAHQSSSGNPFDFSSSVTAPPRTPPASNIHELQTRTFSKLKLAGIVPNVDRTIRLVSSAARRETNPTLDAQLRDDLLQILLATCPRTPDNQQTPNEAPDLSTRFLSLTLTSEEPISLLLESSLLSNPNLSLSSTLLFSQSSTSTIPAEGMASEAGKDVLIPIILDLRDLPLEATGIVCGVAGRLAQGTASNLSQPSHHTQGMPQHMEEEGNLSPKTTAIDIGSSQFGHKMEAGGKTSESRDEAVEISFLSTARAGTVIVRERELERAIRALEGGNEMVNPHEGDEHTEN
jgi:hypothetical protein